MCSDSAIVEEVRRRRYEISEPFGHDLRQFGKYIMEAQKQSADRLVDQIAVIKSDPEDKKPK